MLAGWLAAGVFLAATAFLAAGASLLFSRLPPLVGAASPAAPVPQPLLLLLLPPPPPPPPLLPPLPLLPLPPLPLLPLLSVLFPPRAEANAPTPVQGNPVVPRMLYAAIACGYLYQVGWAREAHCEPVLPCCSCLYQVGWGCALLTVPGGLGWAYY